MTDNYEHELGNTRKGAAKAYSKVITQQPLGRNEGFQENISTVCLRSEIATQNLQSMK
jgi:hypothetical protein